jgi:formate-dependent nitrite reductase membrane component NrfD
MNKMVIWNWTIVTYLFLGGLSGGLFTAVAALESYGQSKPFERTLVWGANLTWIFLAIGMIALIIDLGRPERGINTVLSPNLTSPMSWGVIVLSIFMLLGLAYWVSHTGFLIRKVYPPLWELLKRYRAVLAILGGAFAVMTGIYTGILLTYARYPLWNSPILPLLFLASALATGYALFLFIVKFTNEGQNTNLGKQLPKLVILLGALELGITLVYITFLPTDARTALLSVGNGYGLLFLLVFLGGGVLLGEIGLPLIELRTQKEAEVLFYGATVLTLLGGFVLRYVVVFLGPAF